MAHWAATRAADRNPIWWIAADTPAALDDGLARLTVALQPALARILPQDALVERAVQWLATHAGWLLILDNVTSPDHVKPLLARIPAGACIITSRRATGWHGIATPVLLDVLDPQEALDLFSSIVTREEPADLDGAAEVCAELEYLPLAIDQAAAYCLESKTVPRDYLRLLADQPAELYKAGPEGGDAERTIARIWHVTLDLLADEPLVLRVLRVLSWFAPDGIPRSLLGGMGELAELNQAIRRLAAYNLIRLDYQSLSLHRLVQAVTRTPEANDRHRDEGRIKESYLSAVGLVRGKVGEIPRGIEGRPHWVTLIPHALALISLTPRGEETEEFEEVLLEASHFLSIEGRHQRAIEYAERSMDVCVRLHGEGHPHAVATRDVSASVFGEAGDRNRAADLLERNLTELQGIFGSEHPQVLRTRVNIAQAHYGAGRLQQSLPMQEQNLADCERLLDRGDELTLAARSNLAKTYQDIGDLRKAIPLQERNLADVKRFLGSDHLYLLTCRGNLARSYQDNGDVEQAIEIFEADLADRVRLLGEENPRTLAARNNLARAFQAAGRLKDAVVLLEANLVDRKRVLGELHPDTLVSQGNLADVYHDLGDFRRAIPLLSSVVAGEEKVRGKRHHNTLAARGNLAEAYLASDRPVVAIRMHKDVLADYEREMGVEHPYTLVARGNLACAYAKVENFGRAIKVGEQTAAASERVHGPDHPRTLAARQCVAMWRTMHRL
ncbi:tetratricopeptide repeat protein [Streptomyces sp. NPDC058451]|uniref:tetratricopeptide repeat protein n=1 Tax=Streptomyces sp. NPDC058451 TaxID=3346506 RepID=UPI00365B17C7